MGSLVFFIVMLRVIMLNAVMLRVIMLNAVMLTFIHAECRVLYRNAEDHYTEHHYGECHYRECRHAECRGAFNRISFYLKVIKFCLSLSAKNLSLNFFVNLNGLTRETLLKGKKVQYSSPPP
jgi:hypothetical protein